MLDTIREFIRSDLFYGPFFAMANMIWNWCMDLCTGLMTQTPESFSNDTWVYVTETLYPWALGIGVSCVNLFFIIGFCKSFMNIKENITLELCIECMIRLVAVNMLLQVGVPVIRTFFNMAARLAGQVMALNEPPLFTGDVDYGSRLFWFLFGFGYFIVALVCALLILLTLYGRYIKLYLLIIFYPIAVPTVIGGRGIEASAYAWVKSFLSNVFEIVVIALSMAIAGWIIHGISIPEGDITGLFDGGIQALNSLIYMILMTAAVKGAPAFLNKTFAL